MIRFAFYLVAVSILYLVDVSEVHAGECSPFIGDASINELYVGDSRGSPTGRFVEIRMLDTTLSPDTYREWRLRLCDDESCRDRPLSNENHYDESGYPWIVLGESGIPAGLIDFRDTADLEVRLEDGEGRLIDYLSVGGFVSDEGEVDCEFSYPTEAENTNSFVIGRLPDGSGPWTEDGPGGSGDGPTEGGSNDGEDGAVGEIDHLRFVYGQPALTCQPLDVTVIACQTETCAQDERFIGAVDVEMVTGSQTTWLPSNEFTITNGSEQLELQHTDPSDPANIVVNDVTPEPVNQPRCGPSGGGFTEEQCRSLEFAEAALKFTVPKQTANQPSGPIDIQALESDADDPAQCVPAFGDVERTIQFSFDYLQPEERAANRPVSINGQEIAEDDQGAIDLFFDSEGIAEFELIYNDAGRMRLDAFFEGEEGTSEEGLELAGLSDWVSVPQGFCVETGFECEAADGSCPAAETAGEPFGLDVTAVGWEEGGNDDLCNGNPTTPNFEQDGLTLTHELVAPEDGVTGTINEGTYDHTIGSDPVEVEQAVSEVGVFRFGVAPFVDYFDETVPGGMSEPSGRVTPAQFEVSEMDGEMSAPCRAVEEEPFAYIGQPMTWSEPVEYMITAINADEFITQNYTAPDFIRLGATDLSDSTEPISELDDEPYPHTTDGLNFDFSAPGEPDGNMTYTVSGNSALEKVAEGRVGPLDPTFAVDLEAFSDSDGVASDFSDALRGQALPEDGFDARYGRVQLENVFGPENVTLSMPVQAEYWDGSRYIINEQESGASLEEECFRYNPWDIDRGGDVDILNADVARNARDDEEEDPEEYGLLMGESESGNEILLSSASDAVDPDDRQSPVRLEVPEWLRVFDADGELRNPEATATFGVYRGHDRIIHWREVR